MGLRLTFCMFAAGCKGEQRFDRTFSCMPRVLNELLKLERLLFCSFHVLGALKVLNAIFLLTFLYDGRVAFILETLKVIQKRCTPPEGR